MIINDLKQLGFDNIGEILTSEIPFEPSLIQLCESNRCGCYKKNYACPPYVGEINELINQARAYNKIIVFQKVYQLEDSFDFEGMTKGNSNFKALTAKVSELCGSFMDKYTLLGAGACNICKTCGAIDNVPCRFPNKAIASLESYGIQVSTLAEKCGMKYINGQNTVTYFGAILCD